MKSSIANSPYRNDFPILKQMVNGYPLAYLDNAASTQKPQSVIDCINKYETTMHSNVHRGIHKLSHLASDAYEQVRTKVSLLINSQSVNEIIFTKGTTEGINLIASSLRPLIQKNNEIIITSMEHHANIVPWQMLCKQTGAKLKVCPIKDNSELDLNAFDGLLSSNTKLVAVTHISNVLGTINPIDKIIKKAKQVNAYTFIDAAQSVAHMPIDVQSLNCDFLAFSSHKLHGPTGTGVLYGKLDLLNQLAPYQTGGDMIKTVSFTESTFNAPPYKFEAGTPNIQGVIGMGAAIDYLTTHSITDRYAYEHALTDYLMESIKSIPGVRVMGDPKEHSAIASFVMNDIHPHDLATILDEHGVAIRAGHHCAMPLMEILDVPATARASLSFYNDKADIDQLCNAIEQAKRIFA
jgi:cysteine desulfurase / selenocysteine lyase